MQHAQGPGFNPSTKNQISKKINTGPFGSFYYTLLCSTGQDAKKENKTKQKNFLELPKPFAVVLKLFWHSQAHIAPIAAFPGLLSGDPSRSLKFSLWLVDMASLCTLPWEHLLKIHGSTITSPLCLYSQKEKTFVPSPHFSPSRFFSSHLF
jgi:hypothetical protein